MTKKILAFMLITAALLSASITAYAHSGRTDSNGGHFNHSTGQYHYHHGYSAHQHPNGECPYDFDDDTEAHYSSSNNFPFVQEEYGSNFDWGEFLFQLIGTLVILFLSIIHFNNL